MAILENLTLYYAGKMMRKSAWASRQAKELQSFSTFSDSSIYFMDVGVWAGGSDGKPKTTFGVVCENDILICSWLNAKEGGQWPMGDYSISIPGKCCPMSSGATKLLTRANQMKERRGAVVRATRAKKPLTPPDQLIIIVPDLHLHLYTGQAVERFRFRPTPDAQLHSLDKELRSFLDLAHECKATIVHVGDLYEVWESEILLRMQYLEMVRALARTESRFPNALLRTDMQTMVKTGKVIPRNVMYAEDVYWFGNNSVLSDSDIKNNGIEFWNTEQICRGIEKAHKDLFSGPMFTYQIDGNHDNQLQNNYWCTYSDESYRTHPMLSRPTTAGTRHSDHVHREIGTAEHPIHIEHGLARDWHNCDRDWWKPDHGFDIVYNFVAGLGSMIWGKRSNHQDTILQIADEWAELQDYEMRLCCLRRADEIFRGNHQIRLVIMGHTHDPILVSSPFRTDLLRAYPDYQRYVDGKYWWKTDEELKEEAAAEKRKEEEWEEHRRRQIDHYADRF